MRTSRKKDRRKRRSRMLRLLLLTLLILLALSIWLAVTYRNRWAGTAIQAQLDILPDANARKGSLYEEESQEIGAGDFWVLLNQIPTMEEGSRECNIEYENPEANHYSARVSLYLMETGELLGNTRRVDPGNYVETVTLKQDLPVGEYPVRAVIELFQDRTSAGDLSLNISLRVVEQSGETAVNSSTTIKNNPTLIENEASEINAIGNRAAGNRKEVTRWKTAESGQEVSLRS